MEKDTTFRETIESLKPMINAIHRRKIDMSDAIYVANPNGYIGEDTRDEIGYAINQEKEVYYLVDEEK